MTAAKNATTANADPWLTLQEACEHTRLSERSLRDSINRTDAEWPLAATRIGNRIRIRLSELERWMDAQA